MYRIIEDILENTKNAKLKHPKEYSSGHETYGILMEEVDEFFDTLKKNEAPERSRQELLDIITVAIRGIELIDKVNK